MKKKAALSLSVNAIVIIVIAFVVLGLGLTLTKTIFKGALSKVGPALEISALEAEATAENPITIPTTIELGIGKELKQTIQYYNRGAVTALNATFRITSCTTSAGDSIAPADRPTIVAGKAGRVEPGKVYEFRTVISSGNLNPGLHICSLDVYGVETGAVYESKEFYINVIS